MPNFYDRMFQGATWAAHLAAFGSSVTITPVGGAPVTGKAVLEPGKVAPGYLTDEKTLDALAVLSFAPGAFGTWQPDEGDAVAVDGTTYVVELIIQLAPVVEVQLVGMKGRRIGPASAFKR